MYFAIFSVFIFIALVIWEYTENRVLISPFNVMAFPFALIFLYLAIFGKSRGYLSLNPLTISFLMANMLVFWSIGRILKLIFFPAHRIENSQPVISFIEKHLWGLLFILWISIISGVLQFGRLVLQMGLSSIGSEEFSKRYGLGIFAHFMNFGYPSFILLSAFFLAKKRKIVGISLAGMAAVVLLGRVKGHLILLLLATFYFLYLCGLIKKIRAKYVFILLGSALLVFWGAYMIEFASLFGISTVFKGLGFSFFLRKLEIYFVGGTVALGHYLENLRNAWPWQTLFAVPLNIYRFITGEENLVEIPAHYIYISSFGEVTNVGTTFAPVYASLGYEGSLIFSAALAIISYGVFYTALTTGKTAFKLLSSWIIAILTFTFFGYYLGVLFTWEVAVSTLLVPGCVIIMRQLILAGNRRCKVPFTVCRGQ